MPLGKWTAQRPGARSGLGGGRLACIHVYMYECMYIYIYIYLLIFVNMRNVYIYIYIYIYTSHMYLYDIVRGGVCRGEVQDVRNLHRNPERIANLKTHLKELAGKQLPGQGVGQGCLCLRPCGEAI